MSIADGVCTFDNVSTGVQCFQNYDLPAGTYEFKYDVVSITQGAIVPIFHGATGGVGSGTTVAGSFTEIITISTAASRISFRSNTTTSAVVDNISVKQVLTPNLVTNGTFDTDSDWTKGTGWSIGSGVATHTGSAGYLRQDGVLTPFKWYRVYIYVSGRTTGSGGFINAFYNGDTTNTGKTYASNGWHVAYIQPKAGQTTFRFYGGANYDGSIDNVIVQEVPASVARAHYLDFDGSDDNLILDADTIAASSNATL